MSEYLSEEEQIAALRNFWQQYGVWIAVGLVLALVGYIGWSYYTNNQLERAQAASDLYQKYLENIDDDTLSNTLVAQLDSEYAGTPYQVFSLFARAKTAVEADDLDAALGFLEEASTSQADQQFKDIALLRLARLHQQNGASDSALGALRDIRGEGHRSIVAELKGDIHQALGELDLAREAYTAAVDAADEGNSRPLLTIKLAELQEPN